MSVNTILPFSGTDVKVSGVNIDDYNQAMKIGFQAGSSLGNYSTAVGRYALNASTGQGNTGVGFQSGRLQTTGFGNTSLGAFSMNDFITGSSNTALGYHALRYATSSNNSTGVGSQALLNLSTGNNNTALGQDSGRNITTGDNNVCIGFNAQATSAAVSNEITLGNAVNSVLRCAVTSITSLSDSRDKKEIDELPVGLDFVNKLKPVKFVWDDRDENGRHDVKDFGFIAQDLKAAQEESGLAETLKLVYESNPDKLEASYGKLVPILVKAMQEMTSEISSLKQEINELKNK